MLLNPPAKINLGLFITEKRPDGYHNLETVFYPIPVTDTLEVKKLEFETLPYRFQQAGRKIDGNQEDNLVVKTYMMLKEEFNLPPVDIYLDKRIPMGAGLGGGSSDAAYMMRAINEMFELGLSDAEMKSRISRIGADCAFFITDSPAYATGIGDILQPINLSLKGYYLVLVKPDLHISTREAYSGVKPHQSETDLRKMTEVPVKEWKTFVSNDFETSLFPRYPQLSAIKETLYEMGAVYAAMSGSGSCMYGLFKRPAVGRVKEIFSDCYVYSCQLRK